MKAKIYPIPDQMKEVEFDSPTSVLDLCIQANLINSRLLTYPSFVRKHGRNMTTAPPYCEWDELVNDGDKVYISYTM